MVQLVNGFACHNPADAALARRGINPFAPVQPAGSQAGATGTAVPDSPPAGPQRAAGSVPSQPSAASAGRGRFLDLLA